MKNIVIVGGGAEGLFSAYYLLKKGHNITVIDRNNFTDGCSFGNAGLIVPSHIVPMASPGYVATGIKMMMDAKAPLAFKFPPSLNLIQWATKFYFTANKSHVKRSIPILRDICLYSQSLYKDLYKAGKIGFKLNEKGLLMLYRSKELEYEERQGAELAKKYGIEAKILSATEVQQLEKGTTVNALGAVYYTGDSHIDAQQLMYLLVTYLRQNGVKLIQQTEAKFIRQSGGKASALVTNKGEFTFDKLIIAAGAWSGQILKTANVKLPIQPGKGYSFKITTNQNISYPALLTDDRVAVCPISENLVRFTGGMEIGFFEKKINQTRLNQIKKSICQFYPDIKEINVSAENIWQGHRPCSFDGLPYIGRTNNMTNVLVASGHSMLGITLGPATGKLISELVDDEKTTIDLTHFAPNDNYPDKIIDKYG
jgi:D-amino-acid dehydrogenase